MSERQNQVMRAAGAVGRSKGLPTTISQHETLMAIHLRELGYSDFECEYRFHPKRKWRFDFCVPRVKLAIELEGAIWVQGRHTTGQGFQADLEKYNEATLLGWKVFRFSVDDVMHGRAREVLKRFSLAEVDAR